MTDPESGDKRPYQVSENTKLAYRCAQLRVALNAAEDEIDRLRAMIAGWANGNWPAMEALKAEADALRTCSGEGP
jgi:predicted dienelactone hydrolase